MNPDQHKKIMEEVKSTSNRLDEFEESLAARKGPQYARLVGTVAQQIHSMNGLEQSIVLVGKLANAEENDNLKMLHVLLTTIETSTENNLFKLIALIVPPGERITTFTDDIKLFTNEMLAVQARVSSLIKD